LEELKLQIVELQ
jgi:hypothetical protein